MKKILFNEIINKFYPNGKIKFYLLFLMSLFAGLFEYMGLILIFQFVLFLSNPHTKYCKDIVIFFQDKFQIQDFSKISLILGSSVILIYILKDIYMLFFHWYKNKTLQDLSVKITLKTIQNILFQDYLKVISTSKEKKLNILSKVSFVVWQYCCKYINLIINLAIATILLLYLFIKFTIPATITLLFMGILSSIEYIYLKKNSTYQNKHYSILFNELNSTLIKTIDSLKEIKLNNKQNDYLENIEKKATDYASINKTRNFCNVFHIYFTEISIMLAFMVVLMVLFYTTKFNNQLLITSISTICVIILRITPIINRTQSCLYALNSNRSVAKELLDFNNSFDSNFKYIITKDKMRFSNSIEFKNINFSYPNSKSKSKLNDINLKINKGDFIGIVGKSGCYKTTLTLLLTGLLKPNSGEILIDNKKLSDDNIQKWQNNIGILSQDYSILFDEIKDIPKEYINILNININENTKINELSYGEKQRLALANIFSQDKDILILDEITSSSDVLTEDRINDILKTFKKKKTIISIAHRLQILKYCDKIVYMDNGEIIDIDTFKNLGEKYKEFNKIIKLSNFNPS